MPYLTEGGTMYNIFSDNASLARLLRSRAFVVCVTLFFAVALWVSYTICGAKVIEINDGAISKQVYTHFSDPHEIIKQADVILYPGDQVTFSHSSERSGALTVDRAKEVSVNYGGTLATVRLTSKSTVLDALHAAGFFPGTDDVYYVSPESSLEGITSIRVDRVDYVTYTSTETIPYDTIETETTELKKGQTKIITEGVDGTTLYTYCDKLVNGEVTETTLVGTEIVFDAVHEEILVGTGKSTQTANTKTSSSSVKTSATVSNTVSCLTPSSPILLDANGRPVQYKQLITGKATAYTSSEGSLTATGRAVCTGLVAVNPKQIPYGSQLYIITEDGSIVYGYAIAADTGGFASKGRITVDLFFNSREECYQFGVRNVEIYVLS